jgi:NTE family protein
MAVELFARAGSRPGTLLDAASRAGDLAFGNQTQRLLEARLREHRLRVPLARLAARLPQGLREDPGIAELLAEAGDGVRRVTLIRLGYRAALDEAGLGKAFDFSRVTLAERWQAGVRAMRQALRLDDPAAGATTDVVLHEIEEGPLGG